MLGGCWGYIGPIGCLVAYLVEWSFQNMWFLHFFFNWFICFVVTDNICVCYNLLDMDVMFGGFDGGHDMYNI